VMTDFAIVNASFAVDSTNISVDHTDNALGDTYNGCRQAKKPVKITSPTPM